MKKTVLYIVTVVLSISLGFAGMYALIYYYPTIIVDTVSKEEKVVTVNDTGIAEGVSNIYDAVVVVESFSKKSAISTGSGFIYKKSDSKAYIMTNHHVIEGASEIKVTFSSGTSSTAILKGSDEYADIAVLEINLENVKLVAKMGSSEKAKLGDTVFTIGSPMGKEYAGTVTKGIVSGKNRMISVSVSGSSTSDWIMNVMQTDAAINPGNSGGPLCNINGEVIGINSLKIVESSIEGLGFAIPIEDALKYADSLIKGEKIARAYIGVEMINVSENEYYRNGFTIDPSITEGVVISNVLDKSPASAAGIKKGDVVVKVGEYDVASIAELRYYLYIHKPGDKVDFKIYRNKEYKTLKITLGEA